MPRPDFSTIKANIREAKRTALIEHARTNPKLTVGELLEVARELSTDAKSITIAELTGRPGKRPTRPKATKVTRAEGILNLSTKARRQAYDARVLEALKQTGGSVRAEDIRGLVGGAGAQLRRSLARGVQAKLIARKGTTRATEYTAK